MGRGRIAARPGGLAACGRARGGFTLIELMTVVIILAIMAGIALPRFLTYEVRAKVAGCRGALAGIRTGITYFYANGAVTAGTGIYPTLPELTDGSTLQELFPDNPYNRSNDVSAATQGQANART